MEFRSQTRTGALLALALLPAALFGQEFRYEVWHGHSRPPHVKKAGNLGMLVFTGSGVSFTETYAGKKPKHPHAWTWAYPDIQQLEIAPKTIRVLTYTDNKWKLGADRELRFDLRGDGRSFQEAYDFLKNKLDQRFVAALADKEVKPIWGLPVKHLLRISGSQGVLGFAEDRVVYTTNKKGESRTWRYADIDSISSSGPFQLTITTYERALAHYGSLKGFNFQLKQRIDEDRYNTVWQKVNQAKGLKILQAYK